ncbi:FFLEELY motif protein [Rhodoblastus sp.]|uniref:FFLEELY motif protein n=1 Tax=Rhodoblastus sp. TaxID=1962975 RepID=UPI003F99B830
MSEKDSAGDFAMRRLEAQLDRLAQVREVVEDDPAVERARIELREWQAARLARTHADLLASPKFGAGAEFFLGDLYGPQELGHREEAVRRVAPLINKTLPASAIDVIADAMELDALSESLDLDMAAALREKSGAIDAAAYGDAYRKVGRRADRIRQIELISHLGHSLEQLTKARFVGAALSVMRKPAQMAGLGDLQAFLERGYAAFRQMGGAREFLDTVTAREAAISATLFAGDDRPLQG